MTQNLESILNSFANENEVSSWGFVFGSSTTSFHHYSQWLDKGHHGVLNYLSGDKANLRKDLKNYFPEFKSALVFAFDYSKASKLLNEFYESHQSNKLKIASYVLGFDGLDYHTFLRNKLELIAGQIKAFNPNLNIKLSLDTQPVLERDLALRAGIGWFGKNSMLINKETGSYFILGSLFFDEDLSVYGLSTLSMQADHCGHCTKCIDACPTQAIDINTRTIVADKCISTFTIELFKEAQAPSGMGKESKEIFGCDICQDVCPWNKRHIKKLQISEEKKKEFFYKNKNIIDYFLTLPIEKIIEAITQISNREYRRVFKNTPLERTGRVGMLKNLMHYFKKS